MGLFKKVFRPIRKVAKKIIPKEVRPFLPYIAAGFGPSTAGLTGTAFAKAAAQKALIAAATSAATDEQGDPLRAGLLSITPDLIGAGTTKLGSGDGRIAEFLNKTKTLKDGTETMSLVERAQALQSPETFGDYAKVIGGQTAIDQSAKFAEIRQDEIDEYNRNLREQGVLDKSKRRTAIFNIYKNAGYDDDYVNSMLDRYGYEKGGIIGLDKAIEFFKNLNLKVPEGMKAMSNRKKLTRDEDEEKPIIPPEKPKDDDEDEEPVPVTQADVDLAGGLMAAAQGVEKAFGRGFGEMEPVPMLRFAKGGEVEEEVEESGVMIASAPDPFADYDDIARQLFGKPYKDLTPDEMDMMQEELERLMNKFRSRKNVEGIMQMASGYKDDIEEMYEQYVFEMEEMGLEPMSFSQFLARERAGMADGGEVSINQIEMLIKKGADNDLIKTYVEGAQDGVIDQIREAMKKRENKKDGGDVPEYDIEGETMEGRMMEDFMREGMNKGREENKKRLFDDYEQYRRRRKTKEEGIEVANGGIISMADGGIMEKDMRGGGFIPEGSKERADDVPARLSKNEFVMTADAVRAAGGGSVNKGAKRMYDMMYSLEGKI